MPQPPTYTVNGEAIRALRKSRGLGTGQAADMAGISRRYLSHLENGTRTSVRPGPYQRLRKALEATEEQLLLPPPSKE